MMLFVVFVLVLRFILTLGGTVTIPSGDVSSLGTYLCNGSLTSGTTLLLEGGIHLLSSGPPCDISNLTNVTIVGSSNGVSPVVVQCNGERMFRFSGMKNLTIENITFTQCGQTATMRVDNGKIISSSMVFYLESSSAVSIRDVTVTRFTGFALVGYALTDLVMSDVKVSGCFNKNCSGMYLEASSTCSFERFQFSNLTFSPTYRASFEYFGSGVTLQGTIARIESSVFTDNEGGSALSAYDSSVHVYNSTFDRNSAKWGGAISSMYSRLLNISSSTFGENQAIKSGGAIYLQGSALSTLELSIHIYNSSFVGNNASRGGSISSTGSHLLNISSSTFGENRAILSGGALSAYNSSVHIYNSVFVRNIANWGGSISSMYSRLLNISSSTFGENQARQSGGAIYQGPVSQALLVSNCTQSGPLEVVTIDASLFYDNIATVGGALFMFDLKLNVQVHIRKLAAIRNSADLGAAIYAGNRHKADSGSTFSVVLEDVTIVNNSNDDAFGSAVYLSEVDYLSIIGQSSTGSEFVGNSPMGTVQAIGTNVHIRGKVSFTDNSGIKGGALFLTSNAELYFYENCSVQFSGNTATEFGGAIYIQGDRNVASSAILTFCAIHFAANNYRVNINFYGNHAGKSGHSVYATSIYQCELQEGTNELGDGTYKTYNKYFHTIPAPGDSNQTQIMSFPVKVRICSCENNNTDRIAAWPGATVRCNVTTFDFENHASPSVVYTTIKAEKSSDSVYTKIGPQQEVQWTGAECTPFEYQVYGLENTVVNLTLFTDQGDTSLKPLVISVQLGSCGPGFKLSKTSNLLTCVCSSFLESFGVSCDVKERTVNITNTIGWIGLTVDKSEALAATCPLDYCNPSAERVNLAIGPQGLCQGGREGILCGRCPKGMSVVFGSTECRNCSNVWLVTLLMYAVVGVVLIVILFALNLTVTQGTIYGIIFYANIVAVNSNVLFGKTNSKFLQVIMSFIILDLGFPMCFYDGMDDATKMGLQFVFPTYILLLTVAFTAICRYCITPQPQNSPTKCRSLLGQLSKFTLQRAVSVIATLIYLSYFKLLRTVIDVLSYAKVTIQSGETTVSVNVWFYDGNIPYLSGKHVILFTIAVATAVLFIIPYTVALTVIPIIERFSDSSKVLRWINAKINLIKPMNDAYYAPYKGWCRSWLGAQLFLFIFLLVPSAFLGSYNPSLLMFIHVIILSIFVFIQAQIKPMDGLLPFRNKKMLSHLHHVYNWLDLFYIMNYTLLAFTTSYLLSNDGQLGTAVAVLVGSALFAFSVTILIHLIVSCLKLVKRFDCMTERIESHFDHSRRKIEKSTSLALSPKENCDKNKESFLASFVNLEVFNLREPLIESEIDNSGHAS